MELPPNLPPPAPGIGYYQGHFQPPLQTRPTSISAISITSIVIGALGVLCGAFGVLSSIMMLFVSSAVMAMGNSPQYETMGMKVFAVVNALVVTAMYGVLLTGGIGGVQARGWARRLLIKWAVFTLIWTPVTVVIQSVMIALIPDQQINQQLQSPGTAAAPFGAGVFKTMQIGGIVFGGLLQCVLPPFILVFWRRPYVIEAFETPKPLFG